MARMLIQFLCGALVGMAVLSGRCEPAPARSGDSQAGAIMCGEQKSGRLLLLDAEADWIDPKAILWQLSAAQCQDIANAHKGWFGLPTECKRVLGGTHVLTSASGGGVALIRMSDGKAKKTLPGAQFYKVRWWVPNAFSYGE